MEVHPSPITADRVHSGRFQAAREDGSPPLRVVHLVDAMGATQALWGKERAIQTLMRAQRESGAVAPELICFTDGRLVREMSAEGFTVRCLEDRHRLLPARALPALLRALVEGAVPILHTHGYKANVLGRVARLSGARMGALVATCHGWDEKTWKLKLYNQVDRRSSSISDAVTVPDQAMAATFKHPERVKYVPNGAAYRAPVDQQARAQARERWGFERDAFVVGFLGRVDEPKGALDLLNAAARTRSQGIIWAVAGTGEAELRLRGAGFDNIRMLGYVEASEVFLSAVDVYVQASYSEGMSLSLLEAMRAGIPAVATRVGSTEEVLRHESEGFLFTPGDVDALVRHMLLLKDSPALRARLGQAARRRFEEAFDIREQHRAFLRLYTASPLEVA